jgi:hypothetical protein
MADVLLRLDSLNGMPSAQPVAVGVHR